MDKNNFKKFLHYKMKINEKIHTYGAKDFRDNFLEQNHSIRELFKSNLEQFFCLRIEDINILKYPIPPSKHLCHTLLYITSGFNEIKIGFEKYITKSHQIIVIPAGQIFSIESSNINETGFICQFHPDLLIGKYGSSELINDFDFLKIWGKLDITFQEKESKFISELLNRLEVQFRESGDKNLDIIQPYIIALLCEMNAVSIKTAIKNKKLTASFSLTIKFKELLYNNLKKEHSVCYYAKILNVTPNHLNKSIKSITGKSPGKWIDETILLEAKCLLYQTKLSVSEIAFHMGYHDQSYFSRVFKKQEGITPIEYRKLIEKS